MGDSDITVFLSILALVLVSVAIMVFIIGCRVRKRGIRILIGLLLLAAAFGCHLFSFLASMLVGILGVVTLILAFKTREKDSSSSINGSNF